MRLSTRATPHGRLGQRPGKLPRGRWLGIVEWRSLVFRYRVLCFGPNLIERSRPRRKVNFPS